MASMWSWLKSLRKTQSLPKHRPLRLKDIQSRSEEAAPEQSAPSLLRRILMSTSLLRSISLPPTTTGATRPPPPSIYGHQHSVVVYYTSLRVVRKTFDNCRAVISILHGYSVSIEERDVSMDASLLEELQVILGEKSVSLPRVFIGGFYVGGFEEIERLQESGELRRMIERLPLNKAKGVCDFCGGLRFSVCEVCNGSHKVYQEGIGFGICNVCNANGLIRCPSCSAMPLRWIK